MEHSCCGTAYFEALNQTESSHNIGQCRQCLHTVLSHSTCIVHTAGYQLLFDTLLLPMYALCWLQASATIRCTQHEDQENQHQTAGFAVPVIPADEALVVVSSFSAQPATHAFVPQALLDLAVQSGEVRNQPPEFQHILTSVYTRGVAKPKRRPDDKIPTCNCQSRRAGAGSLNASTIGRVARRQSGRHLGLEAAAAASTAAVTTACLPSKSTDVPHVDLADRSDLRCEVTDIGLEQAILNVDRIVSCLSMEEPEGSSLPVQQSLLPSIPFGTGRASSLSQIKWHQNAAAQQQAECGDKCLNRQLCVLCDAKLCPCGADCSNRCTLWLVMVQASKCSFGTLSAGLHHLTDTCSSAWGRTAILTFVHSAHKATLQHLHPGHWQR